MLLLKKIILLLLVILLNFTSALIYSQSNSDNKNFYQFTNLQKGLAFIGVTGGASTRTSVNEDILILKIIDKQKDGYNIQVNGGYFLSKLFAVGGIIKYDWAKLNQVLENSEGAITYVQEAKSSLGGGVFIKNYIPITPNGRFNLFNVVGLGMNVENKVSEQTTNDILTRYYTITNNYSLGITPGIQVFIIKGFATEVGVNLAGLTHSDKKTTVNQIESTRIKSSDLDLKLNILSLNISFYYFFKT
jgi:hypothetical protein